MFTSIDRPAAASLLIALATASIGFAQQPDQPLSPPEPSTAIASTPPIAQGTVARLTINPRGEVDGLLLTDGTQVRFPPHMSGDLAAAVSVGDPVAIQGFRESASVVKAFVVTDMRSKRSVVEHEPAQPPLPPHLRNVGLSAMAAEGRIQYLMFGPRGELDGAILEDGSIVRFAPDVGYRWAEQLRVGQAVTVIGYGTQNQYGRALEATAVGMAGQAPQPIYGVAPRAANALGPAQR